MKDRNGRKPAEAAEADVIDPGGRQYFVWDIRKVSAFGRRQVLSFCAISPESGRMEGQACLNAHADIQRATVSEERSSELSGTAESGRMDGQACLNAHADIWREE